VPRSIRKSPAATVSASGSKRSSMNPDAQRRRELLAEDFETNAAYTFVVSGERLSGGDVARALRAGAPYSAAYQARHTGTFQRLVSQ
jgi:hypothetical protein